MIKAAAGFSDVGPRPTNEDRYGFWRTRRSFFAAVADGLGGMGAGDQASGYALRRIRELAVNDEVSTDGLAGLVRECHAGIRELQGRQPEFRSMATTLTVMCVRDYRLRAAHCGDTRLYLLRRDNIVQLSEDHSEAQRLFREGRLTGAELARYPKNILASALGIPGEPVIQKIEFDLEPGDWLLIASDGAYNPLGTDGMLDAAESAQKPRQFAAACRRLIGARGAADNYTLVVARVRA